MMSTNKSLSNRDYQLTVEDILCLGKKTWPHSSGGMGHYAEWDLMGVSSQQERGAGHLIKPAGGLAELLFRDFRRKQSPFSLAKTDNHRYCNRYSQYRSGNLQKTLKVHQQLCKRAGNLLLRT